MPNVRCKVSFIIDGNFVRAGSVVDLGDIHQGLRLRKYVEKIEAPSRLAPLCLPLSLVWWEEEIEEKQEPNAPIGPYARREKPFAGTRETT